MHSEYEVQYSMRGVLVVKMKLNALVCIYHISFNVLIFRKRSCSDTFLSSTFSSIHMFYGFIYSIYMTAGINLGDFYACTQCSVGICNPLL